MLTTTTAGSFLTETATKSKYCNNNSVHECMILIDELF